MNKNANIFNKKAFTLAEVIVAAAVFMLFTGALFSVYRMGSRMYVSGSWKYNRQKQAERFFQIAKERIEQASDLIEIDPNKPGTPNVSDDNQIIAKDTEFIALGNGSNVSVPIGTTASTRTQLAEFVVGKPDMTKIVGNRKGLALFHSLMLVPNSETGLYTLHLFVDRNPNEQAFFPSGLPRALADYGNLNQNNFQGEPNNFGLGPVPHSFILDDVASVTLSWSYAIATTTLDERSPIFGLRVGMRNPKHEQSYFEMGFKAKIDCSVKFTERTD